MKISLLAPLVPFQDLTALSLEKARKEQKKKYGKQTNIHRCRPVFRIDPLIDQEDQKKNQKKEPDLRESIQRVVRKLSSDHKVVVRSLYLKGKSVKETAIALNISESTVRRRAKTAVRILRSDSKVIEKLARLLV